MCDQIQDSPDPVFEATCAQEKITALATAIEVMWRGIEDDIPRCSEREAIPHLISMISAESYALFVTLSDVEKGTRND